MEELLDKLLQSETETELVEFKEAKTQFDKDKLGQYFSAFANEANLLHQDYAYLIMGVNDKKVVVGTQINDNQLNEYKAEIARNTSPRNSFSNVYKVQKGESQVLIFEIPAASKGVPVSWKGHYYGRDGESLGALSDFDRDRIKAQIIQNDWSAEIIQSATLEDLDKEAIAFARIQYKEKNQRLRDEVDNWSDQMFLDKAKITIKGKITNSAILLLGKSEAEYFISPAVARITWILKDKDNVEKDYEHFELPFINAVQLVSAKIRNIKYRYIKDNSLFPEEVDQYDPYIIREALHNCIAHQDYVLGGKIIVVENEDGWISFSNSGEFIPNSVEEVVTNDAPETKYRNSFLVDAMVNLNMIDTIGSGIKRMFRIQKDKYFPLPEYDLKDKKVNVKIIGKVIDLKYAKKLAEDQTLTLYEIILLDKLSKNKSLTKDEIKVLKAKSLIEGRSPNFHISSNIANTVGEKASYIKQRGFKDDHYKKMIIHYITTYGKASKKEIDDLLLDILPSVLSPEQKLNKVRNIIYSLSKKDELIINKGTLRYPIWKLRKTPKS